MLFEGVKSASGKVFLTALYLFNALLKDGRRSNTLTQLSLHYIKNLENHRTAQMFFIKLNLTPLFLTMTYPGKSISSVYVLSRKKEKCIKRLGIECAVYLLLTTAVFCDSSFHDRAKQQNTLCLNLIFSKSKI